MSTSQSKPENLKNLTEEQALDIRWENYQKTQTFNMFQEAMLWHAMENHIPYKATFELTPRCSMKCRMCYMRLDPHQIPAQGRELTTEEWIQLGKMAFDAGTVDIQLTGGEVMLRPDFKEIYTALSDMGFLLRVFTNATLFTPEIMDLFRERPPQSIEITLYGASEETYGALGGWPEGYTRAVKAIDELLTFMPGITLKTTIVRQNAKDYAAMRKFASERALGLDVTTQPFRAIRGACSSALEDRLSLEELAQFVKDNNIVVSDEVEEQPSLEERKPVYCGAGLNTYTIQWNGDMVACNVDDDPDRIVGKPLEEGFMEAWDKLKDFRCNKVVPEPCKTCPVYAECGCCAVRHYTESGAYDIPARYVCDHVRQMMDVPLLPDETFQKKE